MDAGQQAWIERFLEHLRSERRYSPHTLSNYRRDLARLATYCEQQAIPAWARITSHQVRTFAATQHRSGLAGKSIQRLLSAVRSFLNFLVREGELAANPAVDIAAPKSPRSLPHALDVGRVTRLLEIPGAEPLTLRDRALFELMYSSGLRLAELVSLDLGDVDLRDAVVEVTGKGSKTRRVPVGRPAREAVEADRKSVV